MFWRKSKPKISPTKKKGKSNSYFLKIALLGDGAVGKTSIRRRYMGQGFTGDHLMTIGADFAAHEDKIMHNEKEYQVTWQIWDLAGQDTFSNVRSMYYRGCFGGVVVFDRTRPTSFANIDSWISELKKHSGKGITPLIILGNKFDLVESSEFVVSEDEIKLFIEKKNEEYSGKNIKIHYFNTSALTGLNVGDAFQTLGKEILHWIAK